MPSSTEENDRSRRYKKQLKSFLSDRRGFEDYYRLGYLLIILGIFAGLYAAQSTPPDYKIPFQATAGAILVTGILMLVCLNGNCEPPVNNPWRYLLSTTKEQREATPVLACLGDSLTQGTCSSNWVDQLVSVLRSELKSLPKELLAPSRAIFQRPLHTINCGQNCLTSRVAVRERIASVLECHPNYLVILLGTNDVLGMHLPWYGDHLRTAWKLREEEPSWDRLEKNLSELLQACDEYSKASPKHCDPLQVALVTLPPLGEDLTHPANRMVKQANSIILKLVKSSSTHQSSCQVEVVPLFESMERHLRTHETSHKDSKLWAFSIDRWYMVAMFMAPFRHILKLKWTTMSKWFGFELCADPLHLNERGAEILRDLVVKWLLQKNVETMIKGAYSD